MIRPNFTSTLQTNQTSKQVVGAFSGTKNRYGAQSVGGGARVHWPAFMDLNCRRLAIGQLLSLTIKLFVLFSILLLPHSKRAIAQVYVRSVFVGQSNYKSEGDPNFYKGSMHITRAGIQFPIQIIADTTIKRYDTIPSQTVWAIRLDGSTSRFQNENFSADFPKNVYNVQLGVIYMRSFNKKWSIFSTLGVGLYAASSIGARQIIGEGAFALIRTLRPNLKIGVGVAFDNTFGYPLLYPGVFIDWAIDGDEGKYFARLNPSELKAGVKFSEKFNCYLNLDAFGSSALYKDKMFSNLCFATGITPEFKFGESLVLSVTGGFTLARHMYVHDRDKYEYRRYQANDKPPRFSSAPFLAIGLTFKK